MIHLINTFSEISNKYTSIICDLWGCLHNGVTSFPEALKALEDFKDSNGKVDAKTFQDAGCIVGVNNASFEVSKGEMLVVMVLSGSGNVTVNALATNANLSNVSASGTVTANIAATGDYSANSNISTVDAFIVAASKTATLSAAQAAKSITLGSNAVAKAKVLTTSDISGTTFDSDVTHLTVAASKTATLSAAQAALNITLGSNAVAKAKVLTTSDTVSYTHLTLPTSDLV